MLFVPKCLDIYDMVKSRLGKAFGSGDPESTGWPTDEAGEILRRYRVVGRLVKTTEKADE